MPGSRHAEHHHGVLCVLHGNSPKRSVYARAARPRWRNWTRPKVGVNGQTRGSVSLQPLHVHLLSLILAGDALMLQQWLWHYHGLGVLPERTNIAIRMQRSAPSSAVAETMGVLQRAGVPQGNVRLVHALPSDDLKLKLINAKLASLASKDWFIYADVDELFDYPCTHDLNRHQCLSGTMWDQMAAGGRVVPMRVGGVPLTEQFPLQCQVRSNVMQRQMFTKVILLSVGGNGSRYSLRRTFRTTHETNGKCALAGAVRHYSMTTQQLYSTVQKARARQHSHRGGGSSRNWANGTCGDPDPATGACQDYVHLLTFMRRQADASTAIDLEALTHRWCRRNISSVPAYRTDAPSLGSVPTSEYII